MNEKSSDATSQAIDQRPFLFISHRHVDSKIAMSREFVNNKSLVVLVVISHHQPPVIPQIGTNLNQQLIESLKKPMSLFWCILPPTRTGLTECGLVWTSSTPPRDYPVSMCRLLCTVLDQVKANIR